MGWLFALLFLCLWLWAVRDRAPALILALHRWRVHTRRTYPHRARGGRPRIDREVIELIRRLQGGNPLWGAPRIHGELIKLGCNLSQETVRKYMLPRAVSPTPNWKVFLDAHKDAIVGIDMTVVFTAALDRLYIFVVLAHEDRRIVYAEVTTHPTACWLAQQIVEAFPWNTAPLYLVRDNDGAYGKAFRSRLKGMGIKDRPTIPRSPWQNGYVERVIGSLRREVFDHIIPLNAAHARRVLKSYVDHYNNDRTHLGLGKDTPVFRPIEAEGELRSRPILGGLHHRYYRVPPE